MNAVVIRENGIRLVEWSYRTRCCVDDWGVDDWGVDDWGVDDWGFDDWVVDD